MVLKFLFWSFCFFEMMMDQTIYELAFWTIFFPYPKSEKIIGSRFNWYKVVNVFHAVNDTYQLSDMDTSNFLPLYVLPSLNLEKTGEFQKLLYAFLLLFFYWSLAFRLVLINVCTWSYKVLRQVGKVFSSQKDFKICQCKSVLKFMYLSWVLVRRF